MSIFGWAAATGRRIGRRGAAVVLAVPAALIAVAASAEESLWGLDTVAGRCVVCHSLEKGGTFRVAPTLYNIVGAEKARARAWYGYSPALMTMGGTWTEKDLDAFLADPDRFAPGTKKSISVKDPVEREEIIQFLAELTP